MSLLDSLLSDSNAENDATREVASTPGAAGPQRCSHRSCEVCKTIARGGCPPAPAPNWMRCVSHRVCDKSHPRTLVRIYIYLPNLQTGSCLAWVIVSCCLPLSSPLAWSWYVDLSVCHVIVSCRWPCNELNAGKIILPGTWKPMV